MLKNIVHLLICGTLCTNVNFLTFCCQAIEHAGDVKITCMENLDVNILNKIVYCGISCTYIIKQVEKLVLCIYGVMATPPRGFTRFSRILPTFSACIISP